MTNERYKQLMEYVGMPQSRSLLAALQQVANEVAQEYEQKIKMLAQQPQARLQFPTMLRKMWSGREVQDWIDGQGPPHHTYGADINLLRRCLEALTCDEADPDDPGHRCGACDEYVDRNRILRNELQERLK